MIVCHLCMWRLPTRANSKVYLDPFSRHAWQQYLLIHDDCWLGCRTGDASCRTPQKRLYFYAGYSTKMHQTQGHRHDIATFGSSPASLRVVDRHRNKIIVKILISQINLDKTPSCSQDIDSRRLYKEVNIALNSLIFSYPPSSSKQPQSLLPSLTLPLTNQSTFDHQPLHSKCSSPWSLSSALPPLPSPPPPLRPSMSATTPSSPLLSAALPMSSELLTWTASLVSPSQSFFLLSWVSC